MCAQYSPAEASLATEATDLFNKRQYEACMNIMKKLYSTRPSDPKVLANKALIELIYQNKLTLSDEYLLQLQKAASLAGSPISVNEIGTHADPSIASIHYNYALASFHQRNYWTAEALLAGLLGMRSSDALPSSARFPLSAGVLLPQKCLLLWLDVCLVCRQPQKVFDFTTYWLHQLDRGEEDLENPVDPEVREMLSGIARPLRVFHVRACLLTGRFKMAREEINELSKFPDPAADSAWDTSRSLAYAQAQLAYLEYDNPKAAQLLNNLLPCDFTDLESPMVWNNLSLNSFRAGNIGLAKLQSRAALRHTERMSKGPQTLAPPGSTISSDETVSSLRQMPLTILNASRHAELLYNYGVQLLLSQKESEESAFEALLTVVKWYPRNPRLWLRLAECCIKLHRPNNLGEWSAETRGSFLRILGDGYPPKVIINPDNDLPNRHLTPILGVIPNLEFAAQCLRNALFLLPRPPRDLNDFAISSDESPLQRLRSALLKWASEQAVPVLPSNQPLSGMALLQVTSAALLASSYVSLCLEDPVETIRYGEQLLSTDPSLLSRNAQTSVQNSDTFAWISIIAPPAYRYLSKMYVAEAYAAMDNLAEANIALLTKDYVFTLQPTPSLHASSHRFPSFNPQESVSLSTNFLLPQTHSLPIDTNMSSLYRSLHPRGSDFPFLVDQAIGVLFFNTAVCLTLRGDLTGARHLLLRSAPSLLVNERNPTSRGSTIWQGSDEHQHLLYPNDATMETMLHILNGRNLPRQFLRLWVYLDLREGKVSAAKQFLKMHLGDMVYGKFGICNQQMEPWMEVGGGGGVLGQQEAFGGQSAAQMRPPQMSHSMPLLLQELPTPRPPQPQPPPPGLPRWTDADWPPL